MLQSKQKNLSKVCPRCCKLIDSSSNRLVHDSCGHLKCRICLLQEITGCLVCLSESKSVEEATIKVTKPNETQPRKSVITSLALLQAEQKQKEEEPKCPSVDKDTCHVLKQSLEKDILFPTEIVKKSTGNFYHLKRVFSQRFFNEDNNKKHKACETEENWVRSLEKGDESANETQDKIGWKVPQHIQIQYFCKIHKISIIDKNEVMRNHMLCGSNKKRDEGLFHQCSLCDKKYREVGKLNRHLKVHTKISRFKCERCGKSCADNYALKTHLRTHTQQKPYACQDCDKKFSALQNYKRHERKHKNDKKFVCDDCGFRFLTKIELKRHKVTHSNLKPFTCSLCHMRFAFKRTLVRHLQTHDSNVLRIKCDQCESTFKRKDNLERHVKIAHLECKLEKSENDVQPT